MVSCALSPRRSILPRPKVCKKAPPPPPPPPPPPEWNTRIEPDVFTGPPFSTQPFTLYVEQPDIDHCTPIQSIVFQNNGCVGVMDGPVCNKSSQTGAIIPIGPPGVYPNKVTISYFTEPQEILDYICTVT